MKKLGETLAGPQKCKRVTKVLYMLGDNSKAGNAEKIGQWTVYPH